MLIKVLYNLRIIKIIKKGGSVGARVRFDPKPSQDGEKEKKKKKN